MSLFKNKVGRPSNNTIKKRNIVKICAFMFFVLVCTILSFGLSKINSKKISGSIIKSEEGISLIS